MPTSEALSLIAWHGFVPLLIGASVYHHAKSELLGALWGGSTLLTTIFLSTLYSTAQEDDQNSINSGGANNNDPLLVDLKQQTVSTNVLKLEQSVNELAEPLLNQLWLGELSIEEFRKNKDKARNEFTSLSNSSSDIGLLTRLKAVWEKIEYIELEFSTYRDEDKKALREKFQNDYLPIEIDGDGNCIFLTIALAENVDLQHFAKKLFLWIEGEWEKRGTSSWENEELEKELRERAAKASKESPQEAWTEHFTKALNKFDTHKNRSSWVAMFNLLLIPGMLKARQTTQEYVTKRINSKDEEWALTIWLQVMLPIEEAGNNPQKQMQAYAGFPLSFQDKINQHRQSYRSNQPQEIKKQKEERLTRLQKNTVRVILGVLMNALETDQEKTILNWEKGNPHQQFLYSVYHRALLEQVEKSDQPLDSKSLETLILQLDQKKSHSFLQAQWGLIQTAGQKLHKNHFVNVLLQPINSPPKESESEKKADEKLKQIQEEFAKEYAQAFSLNGKENVPNATPMWGGEGAIQYAQGAHPEVPQNYLKKDSKLPQEVSTPQIYHLHNHYCLLLPRKD